MKKSCKIGLFNVQKYNFAQCNKSKNLDLKIPIRQKKLWMLKKQGKKCVKLQLFVLPKTGKCLEQK